jgi:phage-related protein
MAIVQAIPTIITALAQSLPQIISAIINTLVTLIPKLVEFYGQVRTQMTAWLSDLAVKAKEGAQKLFNNIVNKIKELPSKLKSIGSDIVKGLWNGINDMVGWIGGKIKGFGDSVLSGIKDFFGIHSPSKVFADEVGKWIPAGIAVGIDKNAKTALNSVKDLAVNAVNGARAGLDTATTTLSGGTGGAGGTVNNFYQTINSPKQLSRLDIYRQSKNLLGYAGGGI